MTATARVDVLGVGISSVDMSEAVDEIQRWINEGCPRYVCVTGVHGVMESQSDPELRAIHNASGLTTPDGMPMVWASRWAGAKHVCRVYGPDLMLEVCGRSLHHGWRHFFYGGAPGVADALSVALRDRFPGLVVAGTYSPPFRPARALEDEAVLSYINEMHPDIVWVGLSTPKQEHWMANHIHRLHAPAVIGVGAAFDIHAGRLPQAPRWMQRSGLEWLYRLAREPRRLWKRYASNNPRFVLALVRHPPTLRT